MHFAWHLPECIAKVAQMAKNLPAMRETQVRSLGQEDPLEKEVAIPSSILAWRTMDRGVWWATVHRVKHTVHRVTKSWTQLSD